MAIQDNGTRVQYTASASQTVFVYPFEIFASGDIAVEQNGVVITAYTLSGVGNDSGGNVTLTTGATSGDTITIYRSMSLVRNTDYQENGDFLAEEVNSDFDRIWAALQQNQTSYGASIRPLISDTALNSSNTELANVATRAGKVLGFDATGLLSYTSAAIPSGDLVDVTTTAAMAALLAPSVGDVVQTAEFSTGNGGGGRYVCITVGTTLNVDLPNGFNIIVSTVDATKCFVLRIESPSSANQFGVNTASADNQSAINKWLSFGGTLTADPGTYLTTTFDMTAGSYLYGTKDVIFKLVDASDVDLLDFGSANNIVVQGVTFDGNKANQTVDFDAVCLRSDGSENITVMDCLIKDSTLTGANMRNGSNIRLVTNEFLDCGTENSVNSGDAIFLAFNEDDFVSGNRIINPARIGVVLKGASGTESKGGRVLGNYVRSSGENAISAEDGVEQFIFSDNQIDTTGTSAFASTKSGIAAGEESVSGKITNNLIQDAGSIGIELPNGVTNMEVEGNTIIDAVTIGIQALSSNAVGGLSSLSIVNNKIINPTLDGIAITAATSNALRVANVARDIKITGNEIISSGRDAIVASKMIGFKIDNNHIKDSASAGARVIDSIDGSISYNHIDGAGSRGVYVQGSSINCRQLSVLSNECIGCGTWGIFLTAADNTSVMNNTVKNRSYEFSGTHTGANNAAVLTDSAANVSDGWATSSLVDYIIYNITDGSSSTVTANTSTTVTGVLAGGADDDWDTGDVYEVYTISKTTTTVGIRSEGAGNANLIVDNDVRDVATGISSAVSGTADTTTPNFT